MKTKTIAMVFIIACTHCQFALGKGAEMKNSDNRSRINYLCNSQHARKIIQKDLTFLAENKQANDNVFFKKSSVGVVNSNIFILFDTANNVLSVQNRKWIGKSIDQIEIVLFNAENVELTCQKITCEVGGAIIFTPTEVWIVPFDNAIESGKYIR